VAAQGHRRRRRSALSRIAQGLRGSPLRAALGRRSAGRGAGGPAARRARPHRFRCLDHLDAGRPPARPAAARLHDQGHPVGACAPAGMAVLQARGAGYLPDAGADGRQSRRRTRRLPRLLRQGAAPAQRRRSRPARGNPAIARTPASRSRLGRGAGRARPRPGSRSRTWSDRRIAARDGAQPTRTRPAPRPADAGPPPFVLARRAGARLRRTDDHTLRDAAHARSVGA
jgi:hypothetical protein